MHTDIMNVVDGSYVLCVPKTWSQDNAREFAEQKLPCRSGYQWEVFQKADCSEHQENRHFDLRAIPKLETSAPTLFTCNTCFHFSNSSRRCRIFDNGAHSTDVVCGSYRVKVEPHPCFTCRHNGEDEDDVCAVSGFGIEDNVDNDCPDWKRDSGEPIPVDGPVPAVVTAVPVIRHICTRDYTSSLPIITRESWPLPLPRRHSVSPQLDKAK